MFKRQKRIISSNKELSNYIEGVDIYNSELLSKLLDPRVERETYTIKASNFRPDRIAEDFYGSSEYMPFVIVQSRLPLPKIREGVEISLIPKNKLDNILQNIE